MCIYTGYYIQDLDMCQLSRSWFPNCFVTMDPWTREIPHVPAGHKRCQMSKIPRGIKNKLYVMRKKRFID